MDASVRPRTGNSGPMKTTLKMQQMMSMKIAEAVDFASRASVYNAEITATELTTAQSILISLMYSLLKNDLGFCVSLLELASGIEHLRSSYLPLWLKDDFNFIDQQVIQVISRITSLVQSGFVIPSHVLKVFANLAPKYGVLQYCKAAGDTDVLKLLAEFGISTFSNNNEAASSNYASIQSTSSAMSLLFQTAHLNRNDSSDGAAAVSIAAERNMVESINVQKSWSNVYPKSLIPNIQEIPKIDNSKTQNNDKAPKTKNSAEAPYTIKDNEASALINSVERIELPKVETQEVWVEAAETFSTSTQSSNEEVTSLSSSSSQKTIRDYLKIPDDFEELDFLSLVTYSDAEGSTPLHNAVREGDPLIVESFLECGAKVDATDTFGYTPTHCAAATGNVRILQVLAQHGANLSLARHDGCTPLHEAIINGHIDAVRWLLDHGSDISVQNSEGWTPLHIAAQWDQLEVVKLLLEKGANRNIFNHNGQAPIDVARQEGNMSVVQLLSSVTNEGIL